MTPRYVMTNEYFERSHKIEGFDPKLPWDDDLPGEEPMLDVDEWNDSDFDMGCFLDIQNDDPQYL